MLQYGQTYLEQNETVLEHLKDLMGPAAFELAVEMAPEQDREPAEDEAELEPAA